MTDPGRIRELMLENLFGVFNERDAARRLEVIARNYTEDVTWTDAEGTSQGQDALNERAQALVERFPDYLFSAAGQIGVSGNLGLLAFNHGTPKQPPAVSGLDVALVRDGRIAVLHTLLT